MAHSAVIFAYDARPAAAREPMRSSSLRKSPTSSRARGALAALLAAATLSACGTGLQAGTYQQNTRQDVASVDLEGVSVRNLHATAGTTDGTIPAGGSAVVSGVLVNNTNAADRLRDVSSDLASEVTLTAGGQPATGVEIPPGGSATTWTAVLGGVREQVRPGQYVTVTLTFAVAGRATVQVPVRAGANGLESRPVLQDPYGEPGSGQEEAAEGGQPGAAGPEQQGAGGTSQGTGEQDG